MRLDKWVQKCKGCGKSTARKLIASGKVMIDAEVMKDSLFDVGGFHKVEISGELVQSQEAYYLMLNKPAGCVSATVDPEHATVIDLIDEVYAKGLHIAGRLDKESTGLILLTNDGHWSRGLTEPDEAVAKIYLVTTESEMSSKDADLFAAGFYFAYEDITTLPSELEILEPKLARVTIYEGKYHQIKRMFHAVGNRVVALHREKVGGIELDKSLAQGSYRSLTPDEVRL